LLTILQVFIHGLYFDNFPHGHYGTIRQQVWSLLHFPLQLAIVGVVEGSQQIALARYVIKSANKVSKKIYAICEKDHLDGEDLRDALLKTTDYFQFRNKIDTYHYQELIEDEIFHIGNMTGICSAENTDRYSAEGWPEDFLIVDTAISSGLYTGLGVKIPIDKLEGYMTPIDIAMKGWRITYMYYWSSFCLLILCLLVFLVLIRRHKADTFDFVSIVTRCFVLICGGAMMAVMASNQLLYNLLSSPALLPICVVLLFMILLTDKLSSEWANYHLLKSGQPYALEVDDHHSHHHKESHGDAHLHAPLPSDALDERDAIGLKAHRMSAWSVHSDTTALARENTAYDRTSSRLSYAGEPMMTPPLMSPPLLSPDPSAHVISQPLSARGGYMAVSNE
jgi:hypothetical protein